MQKVMMLNNNDIWYFVCFVVLFRIQLQETLKRRQVKFGTDIKKGVPKTFAEHKCGGAAGLELALARNECTITKDDQGVDFVFWRQFTSGETTERVHDQSVQGLVELDQDRMRQIGNMLMDAGLERGYMLLLFKSQQYINTMLSVINYYYYHCYHYY